MCRVSKIQTEIFSEILSILNPNLISITCSSKIPHMNVSKFYSIISHFSIFDERMSASFREILRKLGVFCCKISIIFFFSHSIVFDLKKFHPRYNFYGLFRARIKLIQPNKDNLIIGKKIFIPKKPNNQIDFTLLIRCIYFFAIFARGNAVVVAFTLFELLYCAVVGLRLL